MGEDRKSEGNVIRRLRYSYDREGICGFRYYDGEEWKTYTYVKNAQGDIILIKDENGIARVRYEYEPFGHVRKTTTSNRAGDTELAKLNPFRYRGYYYDEESGLYYLITRYYDPYEGIFISPDSFDYLDPTKIGGVNLYAYCNNNPVMYVDPTGHFALTISAILAIVGISAGIGAVIGLGSAVVNDLENGKLFDGDVTVRTYLGQLLGGAIAGAGIGLSVALGAGVGVAAVAGEALTIGPFAISGIGAFAIGVGTSAVSGGLGYVVRTAISDQEEFNWKHMLIETGMNALSGVTSYVGGYVGGVTGLKIPGAKLGIKKFLLFHGTSLLIGGYAFKIAWALAKYGLKKEYK